MDDTIPIRRPEIIGEAGGLVDETRVTLAVHGDELDPDEVSRLLGSAPTSSHRRGDPRGTGRPPWPKGAWLLTVEGKSPTGPDEMLQHLLGRLPTEQEVRDKLKAAYRVELWFGIFVSTWNRGFTLSPASVNRLAEIGAQINFDVYANVEDAG